jgi:acetyl-CoA carboxylase biotin carboxyl carrier protein
MTILTNKDVEDIIRILDGSPYQSLRVSTAAFDVTIRRADGAWVQERSTHALPQVIGQQREETLPTATVLTDAEVPGLHTVRAPMVGTFYAAPKPGAEPFVKVGTEVDAASTLGIIETMKLMNSVPAGAAGTVVEILVTNGTMVQAGQTLMRIKP